MLSESRAKYPYVQKLLYALLITSCKLHHYFDEHKVTVVSDFPLGDVICNRDATERISKWLVKLEAPTRLSNLKVLADFIAEWTEIQQPTSTVIIDHWKMYFDGSLKLGGAGAGVLFISPNGK